MTDTHKIFDPQTILSKYNNLEESPFAERTIVEWALILGYLHCEFDHLLHIDKKKGTDFADSTVLAINDVRQCIREQCSEPTLVMFSPDTLGKEGHA